MTPIRTILVATDFSKPAEQAFSLAHSLAKERGAKVVVLHVSTPPPIVLPEGVITDVNVAYYLTGIRKQLAEVRSPGGDVVVEHRLEQGDPAETVIRVADEVKADWIVIGTHGRTGLMRLLMGSVAEQILRRAKCPVLTLRTPV